MKISFRLVTCHRDMVTGPFSHGWHSHVSASELFWSMQHRGQNVRRRDGGPGPSKLIFPASRGSATIMLSLVSPPSTPLPHSHDLANSQDPQDHVTCCAMVIQVIYDVACPVCLRAIQLVTFREETFRRPARGPSSTQRRGFSGGGTHTFRGFSGGHETGNPVHGFRGAPCSWGSLLHGEGLEWSGGIRGSWFVRVSTDLPRLGGRTAGTRDETCPRSLAIRWASCALGGSNPQKSTE